MERRRKVIIVIILVALAIALYILISTGFFILLYLLLFGTSIAGHDPFFMQEKEPNQFYETEISCGEGTGHKVSGTDKYGFGWAGCLFDNCEYDRSIVGDHMRCVTVTMIE